MHRPAKFDPPWIDFFTRPCPYQLKKYLTFPQFPLLPYEIQGIIWEFAERNLEPRVISISARRVMLSDLPLPKPVFLDEGSQEMAFVCVVEANIPPMLHACYLSRMTGLKFYTLSRVEIMEIPFYINFQRDTVALTKRCRHMYEGLTRILPVTGCRLIQTLFIEHPGLLTLDLMRFLSRMFPSLQHVMVGQQDDPFSTPRLERFYPKTWEAEMWKKWVVWQMNVENSRAEMIRWNPKITLGTLRQWKNVDQLMSGQVKWVLEGGDGEKSAGYEMDYEYVLARI